MLYFRTLVGFSRMHALISANVLEMLGGGAGGRIDVAGNSDRRIAAGQAGCR
jgi:hypothetical protein